MDGSRLKKIPLADTYGDANVLPSSVTFTGQAAGEACDFVLLPSGTEVVDMKVINDALGAGTTMAFGYRYRNADNGAAAPSAFLAAASTASAGSREGAFHPVKFDNSFYITGITAGAAATGKVTVNVTYRYIGPK